MAIERTEAEKVAASPPDDGEAASDLLPPNYGDDEVEVTLIRWMLSLTPIERLRTA